MYPMQPTLTVSWVYNIALISVALRDQELLVIPYLLETSQGKIMGLMIDAQLQCF